MAEPAQRLVRCPNLCTGGRELIINDGPRIYVRCPVCDGRGVVKSEDLERFER
jgi:hypothetical protein